MKQTIYGDYPGGSIPGLLGQRLGYNAYTGNGLGNLKADKINLVNLNNGKPARRSQKTYMCSTEAEFIDSFETAFKVMQNYKSVAVIENEPGNANNIANADSGLYIKNLGWANKLGDRYGIRTMHGGVMMRAAYYVYYDKLSRDDKREMNAHMAQYEIQLGGSAQKTAAYNALKELEYCQNNGIMGNFHSQEEYLYLPSVIASLQDTCGDMSNNEEALRTDSVESAAGIVEASRGLTYCIFFNADLGRNAKEFTEPQKKKILELI